MPGIHVNPAKANIDDSRNRPFPVGLISTEHFVTPKTKKSVTAAALSSATGENTVRLVSTSTAYTTPKHSPGSPRMVTTTSAFPGVGRVSGGVMTVPLVAAAASEWMGGTRSQAKAMRPEASPWSIGVSVAAPDAWSKSSFT